MWTTFLVALKANLRNRSALFWMTVFPIVLATMFNGLFGGLAEAYELKPVPMAVIEDTRWQQADGARTFVDALAGETESASDDTTYAEIDQKLLTITTVDTVKEAEQRLADGTANGYLTADNNGRLAMTVSRETAVTAKDSTQNSGLDISLAALRSVIDLYNRTDAVTRQTIADNPQAALSRNFWNSVGQNVDMTHETTLTHFQPDEIARYYYALLAMSCMMASRLRRNSSSCWRSAKRWSWDRRKGFTEASQKKSGTALRRAGTDQTEGEGSALPIRRRSHARFSRRMPRGVACPPPENRKG